MRRRDLLAYVVGAAVAGTMLVFPYAGRALLSAYMPLLIPVDAPFFLLPLGWGAWNVIWARSRPALPAPAWGALLGLLIAVAGNLLLALRGQWTAPLLLLFLWVPAVYALGWSFVVVPVNRALGVDP